jgi:urate oxidase
VPASSAATLPGMPAELIWNRYGKCRVRLVKLRRSRDPHELVDATIDVQLEGGFAPVYVDGDNTWCLATDTMKNTVYVLARQDPLDQIEPFAMRLADHFAGKPRVTRTTVAADEHRWSRAPVSGRTHPHAFVRNGDERWTATVVHDGRHAEVTAGLTGLTVMKTSGSAFAGFPRDELTTLPETSDRILATSVTAAWTYRRGASDFAARERIRAALVDTFADHASRSVQHTLYAMAASALEACADVTEITISLPNRHHLLVDLKPFGLDNPNEIFVPTEEPYGLIEATVKRA